MYLELPVLRTEVHDVEFDRAGSGWPRLTCNSCPVDADVTCLYKAYMNADQWLAAVREFRARHPFNIRVPVR